VLDGVQPLHRRCLCLAEKGIRVEAGPDPLDVGHTRPGNRALVRSVLPDRSRKCGIAAVRVAEQCDTPGDRYPLLDHPSRPVVLVILHLAAPFRVACGPELPAPVSRTTKLRTQHCDAA